MSDVEKSLYDGMIVQCAVPDCIYVAAEEDNPTRCPFHGETTFVEEITSVFRVSKRRCVFTPIPNGHISIYFTEHTREFVGVMFHQFGVTEFITSVGEVSTRVPVKYRKSIASIFNLANGIDNNETKQIVNEDYVKCKICGFIDPSITQHIKEHHKMTIDEYKSKYPKAKVICNRVLMDFAREQGIDISADS